MKYRALGLICFLAVGCGSDGLNGLNGETGSRGIAGIPGANCAVTSVAPGGSAPNGGSLITCATTSSLVLNGTSGVPGMVVTAKQLCPGTPVYPSKYIEVAFCIDHKLYGVYSANGGFMTLLPPGAYGSNGINSSCNFRIGADCSVAN